VPVLVAQYLDLYVARVVNELLQIEFAVLERTQGLALSGFECRFQLGFTPYQPHALAATTRSSFDHHAEADSGRSGACFRQRQALGGARYHRNARLFNRLSSPGFRSHYLHRGSGRANELDSSFPTGAGESRIL